MRRIQRDIINLIAIHVRYPLFFSNFNQTGISSKNFRKVFKYQNSRKSFQWEPDCSKRTDRRTTDIINLIATSGILRLSLKIYKFILRLEPHRKPSPFLSERPSCQDYKRHKKLYNGLYVRTILDTRLRRERKINLNQTCRQMMHVLRTGA